ncbi:MAG: prepilin peptidase [Candidatus Zambryskibacteria bacterium]|nr:prepilin peptidase [Candidatus Zambryskibacteria bacterium]
MTSVILFVFGTIVGSFLNVVGLRWNNKNFGGRSSCPKCGKTLQWFELAPILSFLIQKGKCRSCGAKISWRYPLIEILTGLIFITTPLWILPVFCIYIIILIYDLHHKIIPDELVYLAIILSLVFRTFVSDLGFRISDLAAALLIFTFFALIWLFSKGYAMGFGDAKLGLSVGLLLGATHGFSAILLAFWLGAAYGISAMIFSRKNITMKSEVPFAPFIILGAWVSLMFDLDLLHVALF